MWGGYVGGMCGGMCEGDVWGGGGVCVGVCVGVWGGCGGSDEKRRHLTKRGCIHWKYGDIHYIYIHYI